MCIGVWRILPNETVYQEIDPITSTMKKKRISYFFHILRLPENRILRQLVRKNLEKKTGGKWIQEIRDDLKAVGLEIADAENRTKINTLLKTHKFSAEMTHRRPTQISDELRKSRSERMKKYWADRKNQTVQPSKKK